MRSSSDRSGHLVRGPWRFVSPPYWLGPGGACSSGANCFGQVTCSKTRAERRSVLGAGGSWCHGTLPESIGRIAAGLVGARCDALDVIPSSSLSRAGELVDHLSRSVAFGISPGAYGNAAGG